MVSLQQLEEARRWGSSALLRQRAALEQAGVEVDHITWRGTQLRIGRKHGRGRPFLLCNGIGANFEMLAPLVAEIRERPVVLFDVPGTGGSQDAPLLLPRMRNYARYAMRVLRHYGDAEADVAGISWGGLLAQRVAHDYSDRVRSLTLIATSPGFLMVPGRFGALKLMLTPQRYLSRGFMVRNAHTLYGSEMARDRERVIEHATMARAPSVLSYLQQLAAAQCFTSLPWLWRLRCPALVLIGDDDPLMRVINARVISALLPNASLHVVPGGGHLFAIMRPQMTAALLDDFLVQPDREAQRNL